MKKQAKINKVMRGRGSYAFRLAAQSAILQADKHPGQRWSKGANNLVALPR